METAELDEISSSIKSFTDTANDKFKEQSARLLAMEQKMTTPSGWRSDSQSEKSVGSLIVESDGFKAFTKGANRSGQVRVGHLHKDANTIINATGLDQPLVPMYRVPGVVMPVAPQRLTVRDLLTSIPVASNMVAFSRETGFTNAAAPQPGEGGLKPESTLTFALANAPVQTLAHWIPASRQIIDDAPALQAYINARLMYGLKLVEERQLLSGDGIGNDLSGLILNSTVFDTTQTVSGDTFIDTIAHAIAQVQNESNLEADGIVVNNLDWAKLLLIKNTLGEYIYSDPHSANAPRLWNLPVVATKSQPYGTFLVGAFRQAAAIWDHDDATVEVSREHSDFFIRNLVAILCEERLALTVFRPLALVYGSFPFGS